MFGDAWFFSPFSFALHHKFSKFDFTLQFAVGRSKGTLSGLCAVELITLQPCDAYSQLRKLVKKIREETLTDLCSTLVGPSMFTLKNVKSNMLNAEKLLLSN